MGCEERWVWQQKWLGRETGWGEMTVGRGRGRGRVDGGRWVGREIGCGRETLGGGDGLWREMGWGGECLVGAGGGLGKGEWLQKRIELVEGWEGRWVG